MDLCSSYFAEIARLIRWVRALMFLTENTLAVVEGIVQARYLNSTLIEETYCSETVMRFLLRLPRISVFILVLPLPLLACPQRVIFQFWIFLPIISMNATFVLLTSLPKHVISLSVVTK